MSFRSGPDCVKQRSQTGMEPIFDSGLARRARATLGVSAWGMQVFTLPRTGTATPRLERRDRDVRHRHPPWQGASVAAVNSALQRAHGRLERERAEETARSSASSQPCRSRAGST